MATVPKQKNIIYGNFIQELVFLQVQAVAVTAPRAHEVPQRLSALERSQMLIAAGLVEPAGPWWPRRLPYAPPVPLPPRERAGARTYARTTGGVAEGRSQFSRVDLNFRFLKQV